MRRLILYTFLFILLGVVLAIVFHDQHGYMLLAFGSWRIETSVLFAAAVLVFVIWLIFVIWRLLVAGILLPHSIGGWMAQRRTRKARQSLDAGLVLLLENRWEKAESELVRSAAGNSQPQVNYLAAARAAQMQGVMHRRDRHLGKASANPDSSELAYLLTQAQLQYEAREDDEALASLARLREIEPAHPRVLELLTSLCARTGDWKRLRDVLPEVSKAGALDQQRWRELGTSAWCDALERAESADQLGETWERVPKRLRVVPAVSRTHIRQLARLSTPGRAAGDIRTVLNTRWDPQLVLLFADLDIDDDTAQLAAVEKWRKRYGDKPELSLAAGRLCKRHRLWGRARSHFEQCQDTPVRAQAMLELGHLVEETDEQGDACSFYRQGLEAATVESVHPD